MRNRVQHICLFVLAAAVLFMPGHGRAQAEEKKPMVVVVYADWCPYCQKLKPVLALINQKYQGKIRFVRLDVTSEATAAESQQEAQKIGLESFFKRYQGQTSLVVIRDSTGREIFRAIHDYEFEHYSAVLDKQLAFQQK